jgi:hypothetical protein
VFGSTALLALKLVVVPAFLWLLSLAAKRWGPRVAGWLAGLPIVAGPILLFIALEQGGAFASRAASSALAAVAATVAFIVAYARAAQRVRWPAALSVGLTAWLLAAFLITRLPESVAIAFLLAAVALAGARCVLPKPRLEPGGRLPRRGDLTARMLAGALLTVAATLAADAVGPRWSGSLATFPVLASVLAVFTHGGQGPAHAAALLRSMTSGMLSLATFCLVAALALRTFSVAVAFVLAVLATAIVQMATRRSTAAASAGSGRS